MKSTPLITSLSILLLGVSLILQTYKNREFRQRIDALEQQVKALSRP